MSPGEIFSSIGTLVGIVGTVVGLLMYLNPPPPSSTKRTGTQRPAVQQTRTPPPSRSKRPLVLRSVIVLSVLIVIVSVAFIPSQLIHPPCCGPTPTSVLTPSPTSMRTGKPTGDSASFAVYPNYDPSGYVGDTGDIIAVAKASSLVRFTYEAQGRGPHEWEYKYLGGKLNPAPCKFAGVLYLDGIWGTDPRGGFDLRGRHVLKWEARSVSGPVNIEFVIGGVTWMWDEKTQTRVSVPYPDSLPRTSLGTQKLTENWQTFQYNLSALSQDELRDVVAGFGWVITWDSNGGQFTSSGQPKTFSIEIQGISYER